MRLPYLIMTAALLTAVPALAQTAGGPAPDSLTCPELVPPSPETAGRLNKGTPHRAEVPEVTPPLLGGEIYCQDALGFDFDEKTFKFSLVVARYLRERNKDDEAPYRIVYMVDTIKANAHEEEPIAFNPFLDGGPLLHDAECTIIDDSKHCTVNLTSDGLISLTRSYGEFGGDAITIFHPWREQGKVDLTKMGEIKFGMSTAEFEFTPSPKAEFAYIGGSSFGPDLRGLDDEMRNGSSLSVYYYLEGEDKPRLTNISPANYSRAIAFMERIAEGIPDPVEDEAED